MFRCMVIIDQREFPHISSQVYNKKLKPVEKLKILSVIIDHKKIIPASLYFCFVQGLVLCSKGILQKAKICLPQFGLQHLHNIVNIYCISFSAAVRVGLIPKTIRQVTEILKKHHLDFNVSKHNQNPRVLSLTL